MLFFSVLERDGTYILRMEVIRARLIRACYRYRYDIFMVVESGNGNLGALSKHWKFVAKRNTSSYLIEGWQVLWSSNSLLWHRNVKRVRLLTHSQSWTVERTKKRNPWEFRGPLRAQGIGSSKPRIN